MTGPHYVWVIDQPDHTVEPTVTRYDLIKFGPVGATVWDRGARKYIPPATWRRFSLGEAEAKAIRSRLIIRSLEWLRNRLESLDARDPQWRYESVPPGAMPVTRPRLTETDDGPESRP